MTEPKIVVDVLEASKQQRIVNDLQKLGAKLRIEPLKICDYYVLGDPSVVIERTTPTDLASKIRTRRLWSQLDKLKSAEDAEPLLLVEGSLSLTQKFTKFPVQSLLASLSAVMFSFKIPVFVVPSKFWTVNFLYSLAKWCAREEKPSKPLRFKPKAEKPEDYALNVVAQLPGVSALLAERMLKEFGSLRNLFDATLQDLEKVEGIGKKKAFKIVEVMDITYE